MLLIGIETEALVTAKGLVWAGQMSLRPVTPALPLPVSSRPATAL